jgi:hypothetical protein
VYVSVSSVGPVDLLLGLVDALSYEYPVSNGRMAGSVPPYQHGNEAGYTWKTARERSTDAERFAPAYHEPLEGHAGTACSSSPRLGHFD